jgi:hypothetical protein
LILSVRAAGPLAAVEHRLLEVLRACSAGVAAISMAVIMVGLVVMGMVIRGLYRLSVRSLLALSSEAEVSATVCAVHACY